MANAVSGSPERHSWQNYENPQVGEDGQLQQALLDHTRSWAEKTVENFDKTERLRSDLEKQNEAALRCCTTADHSQQKGRFSEPKISDRQRRRAEEIRKQFGNNPDAMRLMNTHVNNQPCVIS